MEDKELFEKESQWKQDSAPDSEIRKIQKTIRRRNWKIVSISVALAAMMLVVSVFGIIPWAESLYWNPEETNYRDGTDLEITLQAYMELFNPGYYIPMGITWHRTGFASYDLEIPLAPVSHGERFSVGGSLKRNTLLLDEAFRFPEGKDYCAFSRFRLPAYPDPPSHVEAQREKLRMLPEYIRVEAAITFPEDLSMGELVTFWRDMVFESDTQDPYANISWVAVRSMEPSSEWTPFCGMSFLGNSRPYNLVDLDYRCFSSPANMDQESLEYHFKSLLRYSADQLEKGKGIAPYGDGELYNEILGYVEENGVKTYGVVVTGTPQLLLELMDHEQVYSINLLDCWLDIDWTQF